MLENIRFTSDPATHPYRDRANLAPAAFWSSVGGLAALCIVTAVTPDTEPAIGEHSFPGDGTARVEVEYDGMLHTATVSCTDEGMSQDALMLKIPYFYSDRTDQNSSCTNGPELLESEWPAIRSNIIDLLK